MFAVVLKDVSQVAQWTSSAFGKLRVQVPHNVSRADMALPRPPTRLHLHCHRALDVHSRPIVNLTILNRPVSPQRGWLPLVSAWAICRPPQPAAKPPSSLHLAIPQPLFICHSFFTHRTTRARCQSASACYMYRSAARQAASECGRRQVCCPLEPRRRATANQPPFAPWWLLWRWSHPQYAPLITQQRLRCLHTAASSGSHRAALRSCKRFATHHHTIHRGCMNAVVYPIRHFD